MSSRVHPCLFIGKAAPVLCASAISNYCSVIVCIYKSVDCTFQCVELVAVYVVVSALNVWMFRLYSLHKSKYILCTLQESYLLLMQFIFIFLHVNISNNAHTRHGMVIYNWVTSQYNTFLITTRYVNNVRWTNTITTSVIRHENINISHYSSKINNL